MVSPFAGSSGQSFVLPVRPDQAIPEPIVESIGPLLPELHDLWSKAIATPALWALDVVSVEPFELSRESVNCCQIIDDLALMGGDGGTTCRRRPRQPVAIGICIAGATGHPTDADLTVQWKVPVKQYGGAGVMEQIVALLALAVSKEDHI
jgi:hypothetical protein